jgi:hypothetical protein
LLISFTSASAETALASKISEEIFFLSSISNDTHGLFIKFKNLVESLFVAKNIFPRPSVDA